MTISKEKEAEILRLYYAEKWKVGTIARQLSTHHKAIERVLFNHGVAAETLHARPSKVDPYLPFMLSTLEKYPKLSAAALYRMVSQRGYEGNIDHFRHVVAHYRPQPKAEAYLRVRTMPGEQGQVDWAHFGRIQIGKAIRRLMAFVMVLSWSRRIFLRFYLADNLANFLRGHVDAFEFFEGVPREILYDNLKSAVLERNGQAIRFNEKLLGFAGHYRYAPKPVAVARGNEKGRVERAIRYVRYSFFPARKWADLNDLNRQALQWCIGEASQRKCPEDRSITVAQAYESEKPKLLPLPEVPHVTDERTQVHVGKTPYARFDLNDYSVPHKLVRKTLTVSANLETIRIIDGQQVVAQHSRSFDKGQQIENPEHIQELVEFKRQARQHRGMDRLHHAVASSTEILSVAAQRGYRLGGFTKSLLQLLDLYGAAELEEAIKAALPAGTIHIKAIREILEQRRKEKNLPPPVEIALPNDPRLTSVVVTPHSLDLYDDLHTHKE